MTEVYLDFETYSSVNIKKSNVYAYTESPDFEALMCGWSVDGGPVWVDEGEDEILRTWKRLWALNPLWIAHNAGFERVVMSRLLGMPVGVYLPPEDWLDTAALAAEAGLPRSLEDLAKALGAEEKDSAGTRLINLFCSPQKGRRVMPAERPEQWEQFKVYCGQDVSTLVDVRRRLPDWPNGSERALWDVDQRVNDRGIKVDIPFVLKAVAATEKNNKAAVEEVIALTGIDNPNSTQQLSKWLAEHGCPLDDMQAETVKTALARRDVSHEVHRVLELRQELALVASNKYSAALRSVSSDHRLRGQFVFHGAHTGRWSSKGVQVHNLPRQSDPREAEAILDLMYDFGAEPSMLKSLVRPMFLGPFVISDFSAIEARVLAWMAGEQWVLQAFEEERDLYVETAKRMGSGMTRQQGKIAVLALGYNGSVGSLRAMGYGGPPEHIQATRRQVSHGAQFAAAREAAKNQGWKSDSELLKMVTSWRRANPRIVKFWERLETAFKHGGDLGKVHVDIDGNNRRIVLPSGRALTYHNVRAGQRPSYRHIRGYREDTYGGRLTENVTQAVARDLLADAMIRLDAAGYPIVAHVHDEVVIESDDAEGIKKIMIDGPSWAAGLPLGASADLSERYTK